jgi:hypothetical protein
LTLNQTPDTGALEGRDMHEDIGTAAILRYEAVALLGIEKFDSPLSHHGPPFENAPCVFAAQRTIRMGFNPDFACSWEWPCSAGRYGKAAKSRMAVIYRRFADFTNTPASSRTTSNVCDLTAVLRSNFRKLMSA